MIKAREVPEDGNCLFWATMLAYLEPFKNDKQIFQAKYQKLLQQQTGWETVFNYFNDDHIDIKSLKAIMLTFRVNIIAYMQAHINLEQQAAIVADLPQFYHENQNILASYNLKAPTNFDEYCQIMKKDGVFANGMELVYISAFLKYDIIITTDGDRSRKYSINEQFNDKIELNYVNHNHFHYFFDELAHDPKLNLGSLVATSNVNDKVLTNKIAKKQRTKQVAAIIKKFEGEKVKQEQEQQAQLLATKKQQLMTLEAEIEVKKKTLQKLEQQKLKIFQQKQTVKNDQKYQKLYSNLKVINWANMKKVRAFEIMINDHNQIIGKLETEINNKNTLLAVKERSARWWKDKYHAAVEQHNASSSNASELTVTNFPTALINLSKMSKIKAITTSENDDNCVGSLSEASQIANLLLEIEDMNVKILEIRINMYYDLSNRQWPLINNLNKAGYEQAKIYNLYLSSVYRLSILEQKQNSNFFKFTCNLCRLLTFGCYNMKNVINNKIEKQNLMLITQKKQLATIGVNICNINNQIEEVKQQTAKNKQQIATIEQRIINKQKLLIGLDKKTTVITAALSS